MRPGFASPQHQVTPRPPANQKYVSPPPSTYPLSHSTVKKPVIKFTYGQAGQQPSKSEPIQSTISKPSDLKSPEKNAYSQSYANDTSKKVISQDSS